MNRWFADLPELAGQIDISDCEMVAGADTMLEVIAPLEAKTKTITISDTLMIVDFAILEKTSEDENGANYNVKVFEHNRDRRVTKVKTIYESTVWLCPVTKMIFGNYPQKIYLS